MSLTKRAWAGPAAALAAACGWGTWPLFATIGGWPMAAMLMTAMSLPAPFVLREIRRADSGSRWALLVVGLCDAGNCGLYFSGLARGPVVVVALTHYLAPVLVALAAPVLLGEARNRRALPGIAVVMVGLTLVLGISGEIPVQTAALGAGSAVFYALLVIATQRASRGFSPLGILALHSVIALVVVALWAGREAIPSREALTGRPAIGALMNGLGSGLLFNWGLRRSPTVTASVLTYAEPVVALTLGVVALHQPLAATQILGALLVFGACVWVALAPSPPAA